ncbi:hypothetical protein Poli38472_006489 [Pythium oligandrum]|uniref:Glutathione S-transferase 3, mitochondrial n=1 Tax=Pythium oligandrum TaxID=41045 RepID=A0A8K1C4V7_PYTOL|nr:hypothetical protein Poli38472_006489 [Pythium oligandrum]|eukprot:TMW56479.1 hypothetical protein Poli38472_006489 [Pythium oligandrum]
MAVPVMLEKEHGYVVFVVVLLTFVNLWAGGKVGRARKQYGIEYPQMYAEKSDRDAWAFNCVQRAHQNMLENVPIFLATLFVSAIFRPGYAAIFGLVRVLGFIAYVQGYASGNPKKRFQGAFGYIGMLGGLVLAIEAGIKLLA